MSEPHPSEQAAGGWAEHPKAALMAQRAEMTLASLVSGLSIEARCRATPEFSVWEVLVPSSFNVKHCEFFCVHLHIKEVPEPFPQEKLKAKVCALQVVKNELFPLGVKRKHH